MKPQGFEDALQRDDFAVGDSFWLGDWECEVVNTKVPARAVSGDEVVFRWELTRQEFVQAIADNHPEIEDPNGFFDRYGEDIVHRFTKGFDALIGECGATYGTVMNDVIDESVGEREGSAPTLQDARRVQSPGVGRSDSKEADSQSLPSCSYTCKEVDEKMNSETQQRLNGYVALFDAISEKADNDAVAIAILQEMSKDRRSAEIHEERETKNDRPATEKQKQFMKKLNIPVPANLTKREATMLIDEELGKNGQ